MKSREFQIFVKPVGASCNLGCSYCYYLKNSGLYGNSTSYLMSDETLEYYIKSHIEASTDELVFFSWHGGEPMLAGLAFYKRAVEFQKRLKPYGKRIVNGMQTNGTLINEEWAKFLSRESFVLGISIDGPEEIHNKNRRTKDNQPSFKRVIKGLKILQKNDVQFEILCVVHSGNVKYALEVYDFLKHLGTKYITFLPLVERRPGTTTGVSRATVRARDFGNFLTTIFDEWISKDIGKIKVQIFEEACRPAFNQEHTLCIFREKCGGVPVIEHNGDFYSCDHYIDVRHHIGNILNGSVAEFLDSKQQKEFGDSKLKTLPVYCLDCDVRVMCNGECPKNRFIKTPANEEGLNYLCEGYKYFFTHCRPFTEALASLWVNR